MRSSRIRSVSKWAALAAALIALSSYATNYSLWINGRTGGGQLGNYADFTYWGPSTVNGGVNKKAVNWDGVSHISDSNYRIRNALDCFCTGANSCYVAAHSAGDAQMALQRRDRARGRRCRGAEQSRRRREAALIRHRHE